jgi:phenylpyruvate tautomerase PptA (4-oxalocrotonate tautomerase family)
MPIVDVELVNGEREMCDGALARTLADALGVAFETPAGRTWVRLRSLPAQAFAENEIAKPLGRDAVFVTILAADIAPLASKVGTITDTVAAIGRRDPARVHVLFEPSARGRLAFGGAMVE